MSKKLTKQIIFSLIIVAISGIFILGFTTYKKQKNATNSQEESRNSSSTSIKSALFTETRATTNTEILNSK